MASKIEEIQGKTLDRTKTVIHHFIFPDNEDMDSNYAQIYFRPDLFSLDQTAAGMQTWKS